MKKILCLAAVFSLIGLDLWAGDLKVTGKAGIGTTSPQAKLEVTGTTLLNVGGGNVGTNRLNTSSYGYEALVLGSSNSSHYYNGIALTGYRYSTSTPLGRFTFNSWNTDNTLANTRSSEISSYPEDVTGTNFGADLRFYTRTGTTALTEAMRISSNGKVGIGTTNPGSHKLNVQGGSINASGGFYWNGTSLDSRYVGIAGVWGTARTETRNDAGAFGSGVNSGFFQTSAPSPAANWPSGASSWWHLLDVRHTNTANNYAMQIAGSFYDQNLYFRKTADSASRGWSKIIAQDSSGNVYFPGSGIWNSSGKVGIGTTGPQHGQLHIRSSAVPLVLDESDQGGSVGYWRLVTDNGGFRIDQNTTTARNFDNNSYRVPFAIESNGNVRLGGFASAGGTYNTETMVIGVNNGNVGIGVNYVPGSYKLRVEGNAYATGLWQSSDSKFKKNRKKIDSSLNKVLQLEGLSYEFKKDEYPESGFPDGRHYGVIAQEIEKVLPEVVKEDEDGSKAVAYAEIIPVLIEAIKEQQKEIEELKQNLAELRQKK